MIERTSAFDLLGFEQGKASNAGLREMLNRRAGLDQVALSRGKRDHGAGDKCTEDSFSNDSAVGRSGRCCYEAKDYQRRKE